MPWRGHDALYCKICGSHRDVVGPLSARYKCADCGERRLKENIQQLKAHRGPNFERWRRGLHTMYVEGLVESGYLTAAQAQNLLDDFNERSMVSVARWDLSPGEVPRKAKAKKAAPASATEHQRRVGAEIRRHYSKARGDRAQGLFLSVINMDMQRGVPRPEAEELAVSYLRQRYPDFTPLRA